MLVSYRVGKVERRGMLVSYRVGKGSMRVSAQVIFPGESHAHFQVYHSTCTCI